MFCVLLSVCWFFCPIRSAVEPIYFLCGFLCFSVLKFLFDFLCLLGLFAVNFFFFADAFCFFFTFKYFCIAHRSIFMRAPSKFLLDNSHISAISKLSSVGCCFFIQLDIFPFWVWQVSFNWKLDIFTLCYDIRFYLNLLCQLVFCDTALAGVCGLITPSGGKRKVQASNINVWWGDLCSIPAPTWSLPAPCWGCPCYCQVMVRVLTLQYAFSEAMPAGRWKLLAPAGEKWNPGSLYSLHCLSSRDRGWAVISCWGWTLGFLLALLWGYLGRNIGLLVAVLKGWMSWFPLWPLMMWMGVGPLFVLSLFFFSSLSAFLLPPLVL